MLVSRIGCLPTCERFKGNDRLVFIRNDVRGFKTYLPRVDGVVHDLDPALERCHLEQTQVRLPHVVEVHRRVLPRVVLRHARVHIRNDLVRQRRLVLVDALEKGFRVIVFETGCFPVSNVP